MCMARSFKYAWKNLWSYRDAMSKCILHTGQGMMLIEWWWNHQPDLVEFILNWSEEISLKRSRRKKPVWLNANYIEKLIKKSLVAKFKILQQEIKHEADSTHSNHQMLCFVNFLQELHLPARPNRSHWLVDRWPSCCDQLICHLFNFC